MRKLTEKETCNVLGGSYGRWCDQVTSKTRSMPTFRKCPKGSYDHSQDIIGKIYTYGKTSGLYIFQYFSYR